MTTLRLNATSPIVNVMNAAVTKATGSLIRDFGELQQLTNPRKSPEIFIKNALDRIERLLTQELSKAKPDYGFWISGSQNPRPDTPYVWLIRPMDGLQNFSQGIAHFATTITLEHNGAPVATVLYNPITDDMFWAEKGKGAFLNKARLRISSRKQLSAALVGAMNFSSLEEPTSVQENIFLNINRLTNIRQLGAPSLDLAFIAAGKLDGYFSFDTNIWDHTGPALLIQEAGGYITDIKGSRELSSNSSILAGNEFIYNELKTLTNR